MKNLYKLKTSENTVEDCYNRNKWQYHNNNYNRPNIKLFSKYPYHERLCIIIIFKMIEEHRTVVYVGPFFNLSACV